MRLIELMEKTRSRRRRRRRQIELPGESFIKEDRSSHHHPSSVFRREHRFSINKKQSPLDHESLRDLAGESKPPMAKNPRNRNSFCAPFLSGTFLELCCCCLLPSSSSSLAFSLSFYYFFVISFFGPIRISQT